MISTPFIFIHVLVVPGVRLLRGNPTFRWNISDFSQHNCNPLESDGGGGVLFSLRSCQASAPFGMILSVVTYR